MPALLVSESDFVTYRLFFEIKVASKALGVELDFHTEKRIDGVKTDLVVERAGRGVLVLEAKYKKIANRIERLIEPRDPDVVAQAVNYATLGGYPF
uniref:Restriction endonuclease type IV Mrr domain-containing protein n=1 Tax=Candidatus Methanomethylicus mesodigestus TaxID=1867258 RepID=A0A7C3EQV0_9CREN